jgi:hypothetical protein
MILAGIHADTWANSLVGQVHSRPEPRLAGPIKRVQGCGKTMRFLFQFGEIIPKLRLADAGVCLIYGCDEHPERCKGFIDSP